MFSVCDAVSRMILTVEIEVLPEMIQPWLSRNYRLLIKTIFFSPFGRTTH